MSLVRIVAIAVLALHWAPSAFADAAAEETRAAFLKVIDRPRADARPELTELPPVDGLKKQHLWFHADATERVPGYLLFPEAARFKGRRPVVIVLHGTGGSKDSDEVANLARRLAQAGFIAVAIDGRFHGERTRAGRGAAEYNLAITRAFIPGDGHPFYYDTVWDVLRLLDYFETRADIDIRRVGLMGISKGGMETYLAAAADSRIAVAVPVIGVQSFRWALDHDAWQSRVSTFQRAVDDAARDEGVAQVTGDFVRKFYDRVVPGIHSEFDAPAMLPLIAPRPLLVINGDSDPRTPLPGVQESAAAAAARYRALNVPERFRLLLQPDTAHAFTESAQTAAVEWLVRWLRRSPRRLRARQKAIRKEGR